jgi:hypothetical protein
MPVLTTAIILTALLAPKKPTLEPAFVYNGVDREFPVIINAPRSKRLTLQALRGKSHELVWEVDVKGGKQDLAKVFPKLWSEKRKEVM